MASHKLPGTMSVLAQPAMSASSGTQALLDTVTEHVKAFASRRRFSHLWASTSPFSCRDCGPRRTLDPVIPCEELQKLEGFTSMTRHRRPIDNCYNRKTVVCALVGVINTMMPQQSYEHLQSLSALRHRPYCNPQHPSREPPSRQTATSAYTENLISSQIPH